MSSNEKVYAGDLGTRVILDCGHDISAATARSIEVQRPDGSTRSWSAIANGTNSIQFDTVANSSFDVPGVWRLQSKVAIGGAVWRGKTVTLTVYPFFR
jgi:hypothetical protein